MDDKTKLKQEQEEFKAELKSISVEGDEELLAQTKVKVEPKRDEWMTILPPERKVSLVNHLILFGLVRVKDLSIPRIWRLQAWEALASAAVRAANGDINAGDSKISQLGYNGVPMPYNGDTKVIIPNRRIGHDSFAWSGDASSIYTRRPQWLHNALPTNALSHSRNLTLSAICSRCSLELDTLLHALRDCPHSREVWLYLGITCIPFFRCMDSQSWLWFSIKHEEVELSSSASENILFKKKGSLGNIIARWFPLEHPFVKLNIEGSWVEATKYMGIYWRSSERHGRKMEMRVCYIFYEHVLVESD
ncbi:hypothetical protein Fmac_008811 [Flemingia macrophylla]|uniref:Reverse transcriptase zinc-binding domain-containing protein n=1 Tax=Flemingia macrophylla TaxID=520843 RepID=A0ABD1MYF7_9FABA